MRKIDWKLCLVADVEATGGRYLPDLVEEAVRAGVTLVQLRAKSLDSADFLSLAQKTVNVLKPLQIPLIINDRLDIAQACDADGVHLGQTDIPTISARKILGRKKFIGCSVSTVTEARVAVTSGADYLGAGPVSFTESKQDLPKILGTEGLKAIRKAVRLPILAIGGIGLGNASEVMATGVDGVAVISAILGSSDITQAVYGLRQAITPLL